jgi:hypothetical protein
MAQALPLVGGWKRERKFETASDVNEMLVRLGRWGGSHFFSLAGVACTVTNGT